MMVSVSGEKGRCAGKGARAGRLEWLLLALACLLPAALAAPAGAADAASLIIVFDGSGSMWGNIEGSRASKLVVARDAVRRGLGQVGAQTLVGVAAFGHRRGDCGDVEVLRAPEPLDVARVLEPLERLNPRGRGPLTLALREAAKALPPGPGRKSLILIHDDADNCQQDVCAAAAELRSANITAHVVGLALKGEDAAKMACLPKLTGGHFFAATAAAEVATGIEQALRLASSEAQEEPQGEVAPANPAPIAGDAPPGLYLRAALAPGGPPLSSPLFWTVSVAGEPNQVLFSARAANPFIAVRPGRYLIEARDGAVAASINVDVQERAPTLAAVTLTAGLLKVSAHMGKAGAPLGEAIITIADAGQAGDVKKDAPLKALVGVYKGDVLALLPAGRFIVRVEEGAVRSERLVVVVAGSVGRLDVGLDAARLQVSTTGRDGGGALEAPIFSVDEDDPDAPKGRREVARSAMQRADFVLQPGTYYVVARQGGVEVRERLALGPGEVARRTLAVAAGRLGLAIKPPPGLETRGEIAAYRVERIDVPGAEAIATSRASPLLLLTPGRYRVEARFGVVNARSVREVEVRPGQTQQLVLEPQAALVKLRYGARAGAADIFWEIRDEAQKTVWTTGQAEPAAMLQAGRYLVRAELRGRSLDRTVELRAGETRLIEVTE
jgi:Ca-activated chloride channel family protein